MCIILESLSVVDDNDSFLRHFNIAVTLMLVTVLLESIYICS